MNCYTDKTKTTPIFGIKARNIIDFYIPNYRFATDSYKWLDGRPLTGIDVAPNASQLTGTSINSITGINWGYKSLYEYDAANGGTVD
jgi:hypothetical protein